MAAAAASAGVNRNSVNRHEQMARVGSVANAPWFHLEEGNICHGYLENVYERPDERAKGGKSKFFQIELLTPCKARDGRGDDAEIIEVKAGTIINLNYGPKTKELEKFVPQILMGAQYEVSCFVEGKKFSIGKGQTMWPIDVRAEQTRAPRAGSEDEPDFGDDDASAAG